MVVKAATEKQPFHVIVKLLHDDGNSSPAAGDSPLSVFIIFLRSVCSELI